MRFLIILVVLYLSTVVVSLSASEEIAKQVRLEIIPQWYAQDKIKVYGQISVRKEFHENDWIRYVVKPSVAYSLTDAWSVRGGLGLFYTDNKDLNGYEIANRFEIRPFQGLKYYYKINEKWSLDTYGRLEERFDFNTDTKDSINSLRLRLRLRTIYKFDAFMSGKYYRAMLSFEGLSSISNVTHESDEKYQLTLGLERSFSHSQKGRVEVTWENQDYFYSSSGGINYNKIYLRLRYYPTWGTLFNKIRKQD